LLSPPYCSNHACASVSISSGRIAPVTQPTRSQAQNSSTSALSQWRSAITSS
jgi:hypothetical protein